MKDARFTIPTSALLAKVVDMLGDLAFGGPRHQRRPLRVPALQDRRCRNERPIPHATPIIKLMVEMMEPKPGDEICDPACGTAGFWWPLRSTSASGTPTCCSRRAARTFP